MRLLDKFLILSFAAAAVSCSPGLKPVTEVLRTTPYSDSKVEIRASFALPDQYDFSKDAFITGEESYSNPMLRQGLEFNVSVHRNCLVESGSQLLDQHSVEWKQYAHLPMDILRLNWRLSYEMTAQDLKSLVDKDPCIIGLSENNELSLESSLSVEEPRRRFQRHLDQIGVEDGMSFFYGASRPLEEIVVAVIDTGVDERHEDLTQRMWKTPNNRVGYDFYDLNEFPRDPNGHGTHVAGLIAAENGNRTGVASPAGGHARIMALRAFGGDPARPRGTSVSITNSIEYAVANGAHILNMSYGVRGHDRGQQAAIERAVRSGVFIAAAAGNSGVLITEASPFVPAMYAKLFPGMMSIGSLDLKSDRLSTFSNYSSTYVDMIAPGSGGVHSTIPGNRYANKDGTSMATPIVAATAALVMGYLKAYNVQVSPALVEEILKDGAEVRDSLKSRVGEGRGLNLTTLINHLQKKYPFQEWTPQPRPEWFDGEVTLAERRKDQVYIEGHYCNRGLDAPGNIWVKGPDTPALPVNVRWDLEPSMDDGCIAGNIVRHTFSGHFTALSQEGLEGYEFLLEKEQHKLIHFNSHHSQPKP